MHALRAAFDQPGLHSYPFVEVPLNTHLFHVDVAPVVEESRWQRFIFDAVETVFAFAALEKIQEFRIYVQSRRTLGANYQLKRVIAISQGSTFSGESIYVFSCADGSVEISGFNDVDEADIACLSKIWKEPAINE
jgi:hypothetical protein